MAKLIACPRCQHQMDVTTLTPGFVVRCEGCDATLRVPAAVAENPSLRITSSAPSQPAKHSRRPASTKLFRKASAALARGPATESRAPRSFAPRSKANPIAAVILGLAAIGLVITLAVLMKEKAPPPRESETQKDTASVPSRTPDGTPREIPSDPEPENTPADREPEPTPAAASDPPKTEPAEPASPPVAEPEPPPRSEGTANADWDRMVIQLKAAGGFDDPTTPAGQAFARIKNMGEPAYEKLIAYIDDEDSAIGRGVVAVLIELTSFRTDLPREDTRAEIKRQWLDWLSKH